LYLIRKHNLILIFFPVYDSSVRTLDDQAGASGSDFDDLALDFDWLQSLQPRDELIGYATHVDSGGSRDATKRLPVARSDRWGTS
jgi:hypothetical protein